jgi:hypothetical protein
MVVTMV